jgi:DNA-binding IscR family transcriptional regulator
MGRTTFSSGQRRVLTALAGHATGSPFASDFVAVSGYGSPSGVRKAIERLEALTLVTVRDGCYLVPNPFTRIWLENLHHAR